MTDSSTVTSSWSHSETLVERRSSIVEQFTLSAARSIKGTTTARRGIMESDLQYYTRLAVEELKAARRADNPEARRVHESRATAFILQMHRIENTPALASNPVTRLRPVSLAA
jgi:hypothetical protein